MHEETGTASRWRRLGALDSTLVILCGLIGLFTGWSSTPETGSFSGWLVLFIPVVFGLGFVIAPLFARVLENRSTQDWSRYLWLFSGLAPLALFAGAFIASVTMAAPDWSHLANAAFPAGAAIGLAFKKNPSMLQSCIEALNRTVRANLGKPIVDVVYRTYTETTPLSAVDEGAGRMHGEVQLRFDDGAVLYVGWGENDGFHDHFSLRPSEVSSYQPNTLVDLPALGSPEWSGLRGQPLMAAELRGSNGTPHVLVFEFSTGGVAVGDGYDRELGDGDQILVHRLPDPQLADFGEIFWRSRRIDE